MSQTTIASSTRFAKAVRHNPDLRDASVSVLEVTGDEEAVATALPRSVARVDVRAFGPDASPALDVRRLEAALPTEPFDIVVAHGLLEYLPPAERKAAVHLLVSRTRRTLILIVACDVLAAKGDAALAGLLARQGAATNHRLSYRGANAAPSVRDVYRALQVAGCRFTFEGNQSLIQHQAGMLMDALSPVSPMLMHAHGSKAPGHAAIGDSEWDHYYDFVFEAEPAPPGWVPQAPAVEPDGRPCEAATKIYAVTHQVGAPAAPGPITPILVGPAAASAPPDALTDAVRSAQPLDNGRWCELSAIYRVWKDGPVSERVGFCHYRRVLDFGHPDQVARETPIRPEDLGGREADLEFPAGAVAGRGTDWIATALHRPADTSIWDGYCSTHSTADLCAMLSIVNQRHPCLMPFVSQQLGTNAMYSNNLFVTSWPLFHELCTIWFDVLFEYARQRPRHDASEYQNRDIGFLSERLFDIWIRYCRRQGTTILEYPIYWVTGDAPAAAGTPRDQRPTIA